MKRKNATILTGIMLVFTLLSACGKSEEALMTEPTIESSTEVVSEAASTEVSVVEKVDTESIIEDALNEGRGYYYALDGKEQDYDKAMAAFKKAAEYDNADAYYYIGRILEKSEDYENVKLNYEQAVELGSELGNIGLGFLYLNGNGVEEDYGKAKELFEKAVSNGCLEANCGLGDIYLDGLGVDEDAAKALECFEATINGNEQEWVNYAYDALAFMYSEGEGVEVNGEKAIEYYEKMNTGVSIYNIGYMYGNGMGVEQNDEKAVEYFIKSAEMGFPEAFNALGFMYANGRGVEVDYEKACEYYVQAKALGDENAIDYITDMINQGLISADVANELLEKYED